MSEGDAVGRPTEKRVVEVIARAVRWFGVVPIFDEPEDTALSLAKVVLANLQAKGYEVVPRGTSSADVCVIHLATRAVEEDPSVCWEYDGGTDCRFTSTFKEKFEHVVDCPVCGDDAHLTFPSALPGAPDYGEYVCSSCGKAFKHRKLDPAWDGSQPYGGV